MAIAHPHWLHGSAIGGHLALPVADACFFSHSYCASRRRFSALSPSSKVSELSYFIILIFIFFISFLIMLSLTFSSCPIGRQRRIEELGRNPSERDSVIGSFEAG